MSKWTLRGLGRSAAGIAGDGDGVVPEVRGFATRCPAQIIEGILHQGCKMVLGSTSKSNKSWCRLDLALSVASGMIGNNFSNKAFDSIFLLL